MKKLVIQNKKGFDWITSLIFISISILLLVVNMSIISVTIFLFLIGIIGFNWFNKNKITELTIQCEDYKEIK